MHVLVNATSASLGGGLTVLRALLPALAAADGGTHRYTVVARPDARAAFDPGHPRIRFVVSALGARGLASRLVWEQLALPARAAVGRADVVFSPSNLAVFGSPVAQVLMFQNLAPFDRRVVDRASAGGQLRLQLLRHLGIASARRAQRVVFIAEAQRQVILPQLAISETRTACIYLGRDRRFSPAAAAAAPPLLERLALPSNYLLCVSQFYHYKNLVELVRGFALARPHLPGAPALVLAGALHEAGYVAEVRSAIAAAGLEGQVRLVGQIPYAELPALYAAAAAFIFPSSCESFPNILIEGLASGAPVLSSDRCSMPELAGAAAWYFDPFSPPAIAAALRRLGEAPQRAARLRRAGPLRAARFDWAATAKGLLEEFRRALG